MPPRGYFLRFAPHVQELIVHYLNVPDTLEFATLSKKTKAIVKLVTRFKRYTIKFNWIDSNVDVKVEQQNDGPCVILNSEGMEKFMSEWIPECDQVIPRDENTHWTRIIDLLKDLFNEVSIDVFISGRCEKETLEILKNQKIGNLEWSGNDISPEAVKVLLDEMDIDDLECYCKVASGTEFRYSKPLTHRKVSFQNELWLDLDAILNSTSQFIQLDIILPSSDYNAILKHWLSGGMEHLVELGIISVSGQLPDYTSGVFKDIEFTDWDPNVTTKTLKYGDKEVEFMEGREIVRFDGTKRAIVSAGIDVPILHFSINVFTPETLIRERKI